jgi:glyoxylase-like metal-dependent hydrolase (beta-lactamase superfamily II)
MKQCGVVRDVFIAPRARRFGYRPLRTAEILAMPRFLQRPSGPLAELRGLGLLTPRRRWSRIPVPCFLVEHPGVGPILVDTGLQASVAERPAATLGRGAALLMDVAMEPGWAAAAQLRERGLEPEDVRIVVMTHLHYDHAGAVADFPQATFVVDAAEWAAASHGGFRHGYRRALFDHPFDWRLVSFDASEVGSFASFGRAIDLFGDGSVQLLSTPGHSRGHVSVLLRLSARAAADRGRRLRPALDRRGARPRLRRRRAPVSPVAGRDPALRRADAQRDGHLRPRRRGLGGRAIRLPLTRPTQRRRLASDVSR